MTAFLRASMKRAAARVHLSRLEITVILLIGAMGVGAIVYYSVPRSPSYATASQPVYFSTLPPGAELPSGAECARLVQASPSPENRPANKQFNATVGSPVGPGFFPAGDSPQVKALVPRIDGDFTGTTQDILRWVACKWGIDQNIVFAQAAVESWWDQNELGDWQYDAKNCAPGYGLGADGRPGQCPESFGIVQNKYIYEKPAWSGFSTSTAMNVDAAYAIWRSCYDGYEVWLNNQPRGGQYHAGDVWGCIGRWNAGSWYTPEADRYIAMVEEYLHDRIWEQPSFRNQPPQPLATAG
jgi:autotransporter family porin